MSFVKEVLSVVFGMHPSCSTAPIIAKVSTKRLAHAKRTHDQRMTKPKGNLYILRLTLTDGKLLPPGEVKDFSLRLIRITLRASDSSTSPLKSYVPAAIDLRASSESTSQAHPKNDGCQLVKLDVDRASSQIQ
jgi:hypothetical protein